MAQTYINYASKLVLSNNKKISIPLSTTNSYWKKPNIPHNRFSFGPDFVLSPRSITFNRYN